MLGIPWIWHRSFLTGAGGLRFRLFRQLLQQLFRNVFRELQFILHGDVQSDMPRLLQLDMYRFVPERMPVFELLIRLLIS